MRISLISYEILFQDPPVMAPCPRFYAVSDSGETQTQSARNQG
ncbi:MAG: hypothetical protein ACI9MB_003039, partial [Verrucomicrobiales bacterium]